MKELSVTMALVDFVPVILFGAAGIILLQDLYNKMSKGVFAVFSTGTLITIIAGFGKALYKLLYGAGICDFGLLSNMQLPLQGLGFLMAGVGAFAMLHFRKKAAGVFAAAPPVLSGTWLFVACMLIGLCLLYYALSVLAVKLKKPILVLLFVLSLAASFAMGYLSTRDFTFAGINWITQCVNIAARGLLLIGVLRLRKAGLADLVLETGK